MKRRMLALAVLAATALACSGPRRETVDDTARRLDLQVSESHTRSSLASIEEALSSYIRENGRIPATLDLLVPKYLAAIPTVQTAVHGETNKVKVYAPAILRDGQIDGTQLKDTGRWGYVYNDRRVVVFVDCTHRNSRGKAWFLERGVTEPLR